MVVLLKHVKAMQIIEWFGDSMIYIDEISQKSLETIHFYALNDLSMAPLNFQNGQQNSLKDLFWTFPSFFLFLINLKFVFSPLLII